MSMDADRFSSASRIDGRDRSPPPRVSPTRSAASTAAATAAAALALGVISPVAAPAAQQQNLRNTAPAPSERADAAAQPASFTLIVNADGATAVVDRAELDSAAMTVADLVERYASVDADGPTAGDPLLMLMLEQPFDAAIGPGGVPDDRTPDSDRLARLEARLTDAPPGVLRLIDGQRVPGELYTPASVSDEPASPDAMRWVVAPGLENAMNAAATDGPVVGVALERVAWLMTSAARDAAMLPPRVSDVADRILFLNGDELTGFIVSLDPDIAIETDGAERIVDRSLLAAATLANPAEPLAGVVAWLEDGTVAQLVGAMPTDAGWLFQTADFGTLAVDRGELVALVSDASRLTPLAAYAAIDTVPLGDRDFADPVERRRHPADLAPIDVPPAGLRDVLLPGPMAVTFAAPPANSRPTATQPQINDQTGDDAVLIATAELDGPANRWADCELVVRIDGDEVERRALNAAQPRALLRAPVGDGQRIEIRLEPAAFGPIGDRVVLRRPMVIR